MRWTKVIPATLLVACLGCAGGRQVQRIDADTTVDLSGRWNDSDSRLVAEEMVRDGLSRPWLHEFTGAKSRRPAVIVGQVRNKSHEHIATETFIKDLEREFVNSGRVTMVQAGDARESLRAERDDQQAYASPETAKAWGREKGADFMLQGVLNSVVDSAGKQRVVYYQVDLELTDLETNEKVWIGTKKIKKLVKG